MAKKKGFNPFKMWGSYPLPLIYIGLVIWTMVANIQSTAFNFLLYPAGLFISRGSSIISGNVNFGSIIMIIAINTLFYFLVGYGIHSWVRIGRR